jgi:signal transduction histidine kinase
MLDRDQKGSTMPDARPLPPGYEEIHRTELARLFGKVMDARLYVAPVVALAALALGFSEPAVWRRVVLSLVALAMIGVSVLEQWRFQRRGMGARSADFNIAVGVVGQALGSAATGGLESPLLPLMVVIAFIVGMISTDNRSVRGLTVFQILTIWTLAILGVWELVPGLNLSFFGGGRRSGHNDAHLWTSAAVMTGGVVVASSMGRAMRTIFGAMVRRALELRQDSLREHAERASELTALSGGIAHELKNPLASVKGLAALLAQTATNGKDAERLSVMRREVDRMQGVLEEFLNFSRPLVPLALEKTDIGALCREVADLHEGLSRERGVSLILRGEPMAVRCDPRKVRQVLINLVQNGLEASFSGSTIELEVIPAAGGQVRVCVSDRGSSLDPSIAMRLFQPGVTTKAKGTGLGLTMARALARQHGGELTLSNREGGGCVAELRLPECGPLADARKSSVG